jgi:hypothetical protein
MASISLTKKAADLLHIDLKKPDTPSFHSPSIGDWLVDIIYAEWNDPGILFFNKLKNVVKKISLPHPKISYMKCVT